MSSFNIADPRLDHRKLEDFVISGTPCFSWQMSSSRPGARQQSYRITVYNDNGTVRWDSGTVDSPLSAAIPWGGEPLKSRERGSWQVTVTDDAGATASTGKIPFEVTLLNNSDWQAHWISFDGNNPTTSAPCPYFRKKFRLTEKPVRARLYITARGLFEAYLNGEKTGEDRFVPGWTDFNKQIQFLTYDVTGQCRIGDNLFGAILGEGWYCGCGRRKNYYGDRPELLMQLEMTFADGSVKRICSGKNWKCTTGPILYSDIYDGEFYDARYEMPGWDQPDFNDRSWRTASVGETAKTSPALLPKCGEAVREMMTIKPVALLHPRPDTWIWDMGQNISGYVRVKIAAIPNRMYYFKFGEMLYDDGTLYNLNYRSAQSTDYYVFGQNKTVWYEPKFTFHGFRYVQIDGFQFSVGSCKAEDVEVEAVVLYSALEDSGNFECGNEKLNQLYRNTVWSQRDNFLEIPTDCPQRDERLGWTGDAQIFAETACCNMKSLNFFRKYLLDVRDAQRKDGAVASVCPDILKYSYGAAGWADAATIIPWTLYQRYGDVTVLKENFDAMEKWVNFQRNTSDNLIRPKTFYGDHLNFSTVETPSELLGTAYFYHSAELLSRTAAILGKTRKAAKYADLAQQVYDAYRARYIGSDGIVNIHSQTALALSLHLGLIPPEDRRKNAAFLAELVKNNGNRITTGFLGTSCINSALSENGEIATAFELYLQENFPSWLFSVNQGATTIWERWNSYTKQDGFGDPNMNSFNHYAYGAVHAWVFNTVCGIKILSPGGRELLFACHPDRRLQYAKATLETPYGTVSSHWHYESENELSWEISAPANTEIEVRFPTGWEAPDFSGVLPCGTHKFTLIRK